MDKKLQRIIKIVMVILGLYFIYLLFPGITKIFNFIIIIILPFLIGFTSAYILLPIVEWLSKFKISRKASVFIVVMVFVIIIATMGIFLFPKIIHQVDLLVDNLPTYIDNVSGFLNKLSQRLSFLPDELLPTPENVQTFVANWIGNAFEKIFIIIENSITYFLIIAMSPVLMIYFLIDFDNIKKKVKDYLISKEKLSLYEMLEEINDSMRSYFKGVLIVMTVLSLLSTFCFMIIGIELPLLWGIVIGITNIIPYIGPYIGGGIVVLFTLSSSFDKALLVVIAIIVLQLIESNFITPNIHSKTINTNPILVILFLTLFGKIFGIIGMLMAVPLLSIAQIIVRKKMLAKKSIIL